MGQAQISRSYPCETNMTHATLSLKAAHGGGWTGDEAREKREGRHGLRESSTPFSLEFSASTRPYGSLLPIDTPYGLSNDTERVEGLDLIVK